MKDILKLVEKLDELCIKNCVQVNSNIVWRKNEFFKGQGSLNYRGK